MSWLLIKYVCLEVILKYKYELMCIYTINVSRTTGNFTVN